MRGYVCVHVMSGYSWAFAWLGWSWLFLLPTLRTSTWQSLLSLSFNSQLATLPHRTYRTWQSMYLTSQDWIAGCLTHLIRRSRCLIW